jgi:DNA-binding IscR family transcriptional regulator
MAEVVEALEGAIAPVECISSAPDGSTRCARETEPDHVCTTKILWTRVRASIVQTLEQTTLAELVPAPELIQLVSLPPEKPVAA